MVASVNIESMVDERMTVEQRARRHAALGDPTRLKIVDRLTLGDLSPTELQDGLGLSSNLLAHHLNVLEAEGLVHRSRSEADRRRSYVRLVRGALEGLPSGAATTASRVLFVCTANSARSQLAAALWRDHSPVPVASAGTHPADRIDRGAVAAARRHRLSFEAAAPRAIEAVTAPGDLVITVCDVAHEELAGQDLHWSVPDPVRVGTAAAFDAALDDLAGRIQDLAPRLRAA